MRKIAVVTDALLGDLAEKLASHFVAAKIRHFPAGELDAARRWVLDRSSRLTRGGSSTSRILGAAHPRRRLPGGARTPILRDV